MLFPRKNCIIRKLWRRDEYSTLHTSTLKLQHSLSHTCCQTKIYAKWDLTQIKDKCDENLYQCQSKTQKGKGLGTGSWKEHKSITDRRSMFYKQISPLFEGLSAALETACREQKRLQKLQLCCTLIFYHLCLEQMPFSTCLLVQIAYMKPAQSWHIEWNE